MLLERLTKFFTSLRLTVVLLAAGIILVFLGTLAQEPLGLFLSQQRFFRSFFVDGNAFFAALHKLADMILQGFGRSLPPLNVDELIAAPRIPVFPGGYLIGGLLLINLIASHFARFQMTWRKSGILMAHFGLILLLLGQLGTDMFSTESSMRLNVGETRNYSEDFRANELVVIDTTDPRSDQVVSFPESALSKGELDHPSLPFKIRIKNHWENCDIFERPPEDAIPSGATRGSMADAYVLPQPASADPSETRASALLEVVADGGSVGTWLLATGSEEPERMHIGDGHWTGSLVFAPAMGGNFLILTDPSRAQDQQIDPIGEAELKPGNEISRPNLPFKLRVRQFWPHCRLYRGPSTNAVAPDVTAGVYRGLIVEPLSPAKTTDSRNMPAALVELVSSKGALGTFLLPAAGTAKQAFAYDGRTFEIAMRFKRHYKPFSITLLGATHAKYRGTEVAKDFRSRVRVQRNDTGEARETEIYMNAPLRFAGYTFFQYQMFDDRGGPMTGPEWSAFQVVHNPSWMTPYVSCVLVGLGLLVQFMIHLVGFVMRQKPV